jgi:hypothetical protein
VVAQFLETLPRDRWLEMRERVRRHREWLEFVKRPTDPADRLLAYRGTFSLRIHVLPYAEVRGPLAETLPSGERYTPLALEDVEIADAAVELFHPDHRAWTVPLEGLENGRRYVIEGSWDRPDEIRLRPE